jgi:hypothetical protein
MAGWLRKPKEESESVAAVYEDELRLRMPSSVRGPEGNRLTRLEPADMVSLDIDGDDDEDLEFLATIVDEVKKEETEAPPPPRAQKSAVPLQRAPANVDETLRIFAETREMHHERRSSALNPPHVEMADLLEDLALIRAAMRARKAA